MFAVVHSNNYKLTVVPGSNPNGMHLKVNGLSSREEKGQRKSMFILGEPTRGNQDMRFICGHCAVTKKHLIRC